MVGQAFDLVVGVAERLEDEAPDMAAADRVDLASAVALRLDQTGQPELRQMLTDSGGTDARETGQGRDIGRPVRKHPEDAEPARVREQRETCCGSAHLRIRREDEIGRCQLMRPGSAHDDIFSLFPYLR